MRLTFSVLWFDDDVDYFDSLDLDPLKAEINSWGFSPRILQATTSEEFMKHVPFEAFDLIVVDRNLEGYDDGQEFIAKIRSNAIYTETIFYSAGNTSDLWEAIREKKLEGVFVSSRLEIISKISLIGRQSIRKVLDLENMRGIVMAEVGELDLLLDEIIMTGMKSLQKDQQQSIFKGFHRNIQKQRQSQDSDLDQFIANPQTAVMLALCDSDKRWQNLKRLWKTHEKLKGMDSIGDYVEDVLKPRNFLAHGRPKPREDGSFIFQYREKEYIFDEANSLKLRQTILRYKRSFSDIIAIVKEL